MKVIHRFVAGVVLLPFVLGCGSGADSESADIIPFCKMERLSFSELPERVFSAMEYIVPETGENQDMLFSSVDQVEYKDGKLYILDWRYRRLVVFDIDGQPVSSLRRQGRGPGEYLQISAFDVDSDGTMWILDAQKDVLNAYGADGVFRESMPLPFQTDFLKCLDNGKFLFKLSTWDESDYKGKCILLTDRNLNVEEAFVEYGPTDPNFELSSPGLNDCGDFFIYHFPICDDVYRLSKDGIPEKEYHFDFGSRTVPEEARTDIESSLDDFDGYTALAGALYMDDAVGIGTIYDSRDYKGFFMDRKSGKVYVQDSGHACLTFVGVSGGVAVFYIPGGSGGADFLPDDIRQASGAGDDVFALLPVDRCRL